MAEDGYTIVCDSFDGDDEGDCLTCGHEKKCHGESNAESSNPLVAFLREGREALGSNDCRMTDEWLADLDLALRAASEPPAMHEHKWRLPDPPVTASNYYCGECGYFPGPDVKTAACPKCGAAAPEHFGFCDNLEMPSENGIVIR